LGVFVISHQSVADLGGRDDRSSLREIFFNFSSKNKRKTNLYFLEWALKSESCK
jgi:hypothetical protein